ncbi:MAG: hypothetical protein DRJ18_00630 [Candidatus Methanomethylicota archaeon]|nr:MAG: hypothetical protein DRJ18_00630 [Candidatus Verstraetearchaeota archaeon]
MSWEKLAILKAMLAACYYLHSCGYRRASMALAAWTCSRAAFYFPKHERRLMDIRSKALRVRDLPLRPPIEETLEPLADLTHVANDIEDELLDEWRRQRASTAPSSS